MALFGVFLGLFIVAVYIWLTSKGKKWKKIPGRAYRTVELMYAEKNKWMNATAVNAITFYQGNVDTSVVVKRLYEILKANPWLACRLVKENGKDIHMEFPEEIGPSDLSRHYTEIQIDNNRGHNPFNESASIETLFSRVEKHLIKIGRECINLDELLFKVILVKITDKNNTEVNKTAFILSLSHTIGDGHTFYQVYSMFNYNTKVQPLIVEREHKFIQYMEAINGNKLISYFKSPLIVLSILTHRLLLSLRGKHAKLFSYEVKKEEISKLKSLFLPTKKSSTTENNKNNNNSNSNDNDSSISFLSTNDILTSWFLKKLACSYGFMVINYRNRLVEFTNQLAGNYEHVLFYSQRDYQLPNQIRKSLQLFKSEHQDIPNLFETIRYEFGLVTNWSSFYQEVILQKECPLLVHLPLMSRDGVAMKGAMVIYCPRKDALGVYIIVNEDQSSDEDWLEGSSFLQHHQH